MEEESSGRVLALVGDLIQSRSVPDRGALQIELQSVLERVNLYTSPVQPLSITIGDEFQATYSSIAEGINASLQVRLELLETINVRFGLGWGTITVQGGNNSPFGQDGPAWWLARDALEKMRDTEQKSKWPAGWSTKLKADGSIEESIYNAYLLCRDEIINGMDRIDATITLSLLRGGTQRTIGANLGISQSAVSQRQRRKGALALYRSFLAIMEPSQWDQ